MTECSPFSVVEENELDFERLQRVFGKMNIKNPAVRVKDGCEALDLPAESGPQPKRKKPYVILLDGRLRRSGFVPVSQRSSKRYVSG